ncbi:MAG: hypothetical protein GW757_12480 [Alphaproteobacteria bacterium]|nr:hypothetical protein [Alphaproteobacteria bacterium]
MMKYAAPLAGVIVLAACAPVVEPRTPVAAVEPAVEIAGESRTCVNASSIRSTSVRGDGVIDFTLTGGDVYRNALGGGCPALRRNDAISYDVRGGSLCQGEIVYRLDTYGNRLSRGAGCGLGEFVPVEYVDQVSDGPTIMGE